MPAFPLYKWSSFATKLHNESLKKFIKYNNWFCYLFKHDIVFDFVKNIISKVIKQTKIITMRIKTPRMMKITVYQYCDKNFFKEAMLSSDSKSFLRVAKGPDGSTLVKFFI